MNKKLKEVNQNYGANSDFKIKKSNTFKVIFWAATALVIVFFIIKSLC
jgi:hypothetical protein